MNIDELKEYLKVDYTDEDSTISGLQIAAEEYLTNAGINNDYSKELYKLGVKLLVSHWYDNRTILGKADKLPFNIDSIITQLKYTQEDVII